MASGSYSDRDGACIPSAYHDITGIFLDDALQHKAHVVHGWIYSTKLNKLIKHAWIEFTDERESLIYEVVNQEFMPKKFLEEKYQLKAVKRYTFQEIIKLSILTKSKGGYFEF